MNSKLVASTCDKVGGWIAYGQNKSSFVFSSVCTTASVRFSRMEMLLVLIFIAFLTIPTTAQISCQLTCDDQKNISIGTDGYAIIFPELVLNGDFSCAAPVTVEVQDESGAPIGNRVGCDEVGRTLTVKVTGANNEGCWSSIKVENKLATTIDCQDVFIPCTASILPDSIGYPTLQANCGTTNQGDLKYFDLFTELDCGTIIEGREVNARITRSWTIVDQYDNVGFCTQNIYLLKGYINNVVFPGNCDGVTRATLSCAADPTNLLLTGAPTINGLPVENAGFCKFFVNYQDQTADICPPGSYRILRRWEVIDLCTKEVKVHIQDIILADNEGPNLFCPDTVFVSANDLNCASAIIIPQAVAYDSCSNAIVTPSWEFGEGYGPFTEVPSGSHTVTYTARDECGNTSTCTSVIIVEDNSKPVAVCRDQVHIALSNDGIATVPATIFDGGSQDNCGIAKIEAKKDSVFSEYLTFYCDDLDELQLIILQVTDQAGHINECRSQLIIDDELLPTVVCPPTVSVDCQDDYEDVMLTGEATATDDCFIKSLTFIDALDFNACGTSGIVRRNWFAEDQAGNIGTCTQVIAVQDETPLQIIFPKEFTTFDCGSDLSSTITGEPLITGDNCESILISHTDERVELGGSTCYQILRNWRVIDWCDFNGTDSEAGGLYTFTQIINVLDWTNPEITFCPEDVSVEISSFECVTSVELPLIIAQDCNALLTYSNDSPYADVNKEDASGMYPQGTTTVTYTVSDGCGNSSNCQVNVTVIDTQAPTPVCKHSISIALRSDGTVFVPHDAINSGSYDNCGGNTNLSYEISPNYFTCTDIGQQSINLIVTDVFGNSDFCTTDIFIQDNHDNCNPLGLSAIGGKVVTESGAAMQEVAVAISGGMSEMSQTNIAGEYLFENLSKQQSYMVQPMTGAYPKEGVSTFDIVLIQKHILGNELLASPYRLIAADVNNSGSITTFDVVQLRRLILGIIEEFPNNESWRYIPSEYVFENPTNPFEENYPEQIEYDQLLNSQLERDFIAIKVGDVNNSASPDAMVGTARTAADAVQLQISNNDLQANQQYEIPISIKDGTSLIGFQFALAIDPTVLQIEEVRTNENQKINSTHFGLHHLDNGLLTISWDDITQPLKAGNNLLFTLVVTAKQYTNLADALSLLSEKIAAEAYTEAKALLPVELLFLDQQAKLFQNQPNPFQQTTTIGFQLPKATSGTIRILDINGRLLKRYNDNFQHGYNEIQVDMSDLTSQGGVFYYQLETPLTERLSKKMIVVQ